MLFLLAEPSIGSHCVVVKPSQEQINLIPCGRTTQALKGIDPNLCLVAFALIHKKELVSHKVMKMIKQLTTSIYMRSLMAN